MVDLLPSCSRRIQTKIWLGDRSTCNRLYLYPLATWIARNLDEIRTLLQIFWARTCVTWSRAGWTCVVISRGSETDHYKCLLCFPLWQEVGNSPPGVMCSRELREKRREVDPLSLDPGVCITSVFLFLWRASTGWQSLKCVSHPLHRWSDNRHFLKGRDTRGWCGNSSATVRIWSLRTRVGFWSSGCLRLVSRIECDGSDPIRSDTCRLLIKWTLENWGLKAYLSSSWEFEVLNSRYLGFFPLYK